jgi:hypothetical protein
MKRYRCCDHSRMVHSISLHSFSSSIPTPPMPRIDVPTSYLPVTPIDIESKHPIAIRIRKIIFPIDTASSTARCVDDHHTPRNYHARDRVCYVVSEGMRVLRDGIERQVLAVATSIAFDGRDNNVCSQGVESCCDDCRDQDCLHESLLVLAGEHLRSLLSCVPERHRGNPL